MSSASDFAQLHKLKPKDAVAWLQGRGQLSVTYAWQDVWQEEHGVQFTVSRLARLDLLQAIYEGIVQSVQGNLSRTDWMDDIEALLIKAGWWGKKAVTDPVDGEIKLTEFNPVRLRLIYDTNTRQAYATGLWERADRARRTHPYLRYITRRDENVRAAHRAWDNLVLPVDHSFWKTHWPPNGWRCRCRVMSMSQAEYDRGQSLERQGAEQNIDAQGTYKRFNTQEPVIPLREYVNPRTGEVVHVPEGIDPGFAFNPGQARQQAQQQLIQSKLAAVAPSLAKVARDDGLTKGS